LDLSTLALLNRPRCNPYSGRSECQIGVRSDPFRAPPREARPAPGPGRRG